MKLAMTMLTAFLLGSGIQTASAPAQAQGSTQAQTQAPAVPVTLKNFTRAETDAYFTKSVKLGAFGKFMHIREPAPIDKQDVVRMNRDTLYSAAVFDLDASPVVIALPKTGTRFMSLLIVSEDHYSPKVVYAPGTYRFTRKGVGTRYVMAIIRTLVNPNDPEDIKEANAAQDAIKAQQANVGKFEIPNWEPKSHEAVRDLLVKLSAFQGDDPPPRFGLKSEVDPVYHLVASASGWGGNPRDAAVYDSVFPRQNDGKTVYKLTVKDVPVDGFWSISVYNEKGYFEKNDLGAYSVNNITAKKDANGAVTVQFGGCQKDTPNCIPIMPGWSYVARQYRPRKAILDGKWKFPEARPVQ